MQRKLSGAMIGGVAASVCGMLLFACGNNQNLSFQGYVDGRYTYLASQVTGQLSRLAVARGERIKQGDLLFQLDPEPTNFEVEEAKAQLAKSTVTLHDLEKGERLPNLLAIKAQYDQVMDQLENAKLTVARYKELIKTGYIDRAAYDKSITDVNNLQHRSEEIIQDYKAAELAARSDQIKAAIQQVNMDTAQLNSAQWRLAQKTIRSPISGFIFDTHHLNGDIVPANQTVVSLLSNDDITVVFFVPEETVKSLRMNQGVNIYDLDDHFFMKGNISYISPSAEYTPPVIYSRERMDKLIYRIEAKPVDVTHLHPGQPVTVKLIKVTA